jgi:methyltransferase family protein
MRLFGRTNRESERDLVLRKMPRKAVCAEIGVFSGDFSARILTATCPRRLHLIDPWKFEPDPTYERAVYGGVNIEGQPAMDALHETVRQRFAREIHSGNVIVHRSAAAEAAAEFADEYFDWVYVDGNHQYEFVLLDLESYYPKVKAGGFLVGDDYGVEGWWHGGVTRAVRDFAQRGGCEKLVVRGDQFLLRKKRR